MLLPILLGDYTTFDKVAGTFSKIKKIFSVLPADFGEDCQAVTLRHLSMQEPN
jgi:hypothetical protein